MDIGKDYINPQLRDGLSQAKSVEEITSVKSMFPALSLEDLTDGCKCPDGGVYSSDGGIIDRK